MKKSILTLALVLAALVSSAQGSWFFPDEGKVNRYSTTATALTEKTTLYTSVYVKSADNGAYTVQSTVFQNENDTNLMQSVSAVYKTVQGGYELDMRETLKSSFAALGDLKVEEYSGDAVYPKNPSVGQSYDNITMTLGANIQGNAFNISVEVKDRKITAKETIEVPAGKFDCLKFEETTIAKVMGQEIKTQTTTWIAKGIGTVKQETDSMNGMVKAVMELTAVKNK